MRTPITLSVVSILGCGGTAATGPVKTPSDLAAAHSKWAKAIANADAVTLYEGLPHQFYDEEALKKDAQEKQTVHHHGFPFYAETLSLSQGDAAKLKHLASDTDSYTVATGTKKCGGFHPDYCVEWKGGGEIYRMLICFGCGEVKFYGPGVELYCDSAHVRGGLAEVLRAYQKNRRSWKGS